MYKRSSQALLLSLSIFVTTFGQTPKQTTQSQTDTDEVVRITTNLVQLDAVVTDKKGRLVTDLTADDFEVYEDGHQQQITNLSFITTDPAGATTASDSSPTARTAKGAPAPVMPPVRVQPEQVRRTVALVVDDLCLSWSSVVYARKALKKFVDVQMQPGDLVAIIRTAGGVGILQQFTSDKRQLYAAIERIKYYPTPCNHVESFEQLNDMMKLPDSMTNPALAAGKSAGDYSRTSSGDIGRLAQDTFTIGTFGALSYIVRGLKDLPGRKSILLISDGFSLYDRKSGDMRRVLEAIDRVTDLAGRSSVVISTLDARGLAITNFTASESILASDINGPSGSGPGAYNKAAEVATSRVSLYNDTKEGLTYLAEQTGGLAIQNTNDLAGGIKRVMDQQRGYYLIGYRPDESTFDRAGRSRFHKFTVKVKRPGLTVRTRKGFYGVPEEVIAAATAPTRAEQLVKALISPFNSNDISLRLTSLYGNDAKAGAYMRSLLYIDASDLTFKQESDGWYQAVMDVMAITFGDNGRVVDKVSKTQTIRVRGKTYENMLKNGLVYFMNVPVKQAGAYQLRLAVRDSATDHVGTASQFIEVPDLKKKQLLLSGLVVNGYQQERSATTVQASAQDSMASSEGTSDEPDPQASAAVRRFRGGMVLNYAYAIYNAQPNKANAGRPQLETQIRLFRDGKLVYTGQPQPPDLSGQTDGERLLTGGALQLSPDMPPGEYYLQINVTDLQAKDKNRRTATQWIDFDIVK
jgi:VWFA-related protein